MKELRCTVCKTPLVKGNIGYVRSDRSGNKEFLCKQCHLKRGVVKKEHHGDEWMLVT